MRFRALLFACLAAAVVAATAIASRGDVPTAVNPSLVDINTSLYQQGKAAGTGIVLTSDGVILTNNHVIRGATKITATSIGTGKTYTAKVLGYSVTNDVAVIKLLNASGLTPATIGNS